MLKRTLLTAAIAFALSAPVAAKYYLVVPGAASFGSSSSGGSEIEEDLNAPADPEQEGAKGELITFNTSYLDFGSEGKLGATKSLTIEATNSGEEEITNYTFNINEGARGFNFHQNGPLICAGIEVPQVGNMLPGETCSLELGASMTSTYHLSGGSFYGAFEYSSDQLQGSIPMTFKAISPTMEAFFDSGGAVPGPEVGPELIFDGSSTSYRSVFIENNGNAPLYFQGINLPPKDVSLSSNTTCSEQAPVEAGSFCELEIEVQQGSPEGLGAVLIHHKDYQGQDGSPGTYVLVINRI